MLRYPVAVLISCLMTAVLFALMYHLISGSKAPPDFYTEFNTIDIYQAPAEQAEKPKNEPPPDEPPQTTEPVMEELKVSAPKPSLAAPANLPMPSFDIRGSDVAVQSGHGDIFGTGGAGGTGTGKWSPPGDAGLAKKFAPDGKKKGDAGYVEVVPSATRQPNIPEAAWKAKVDGWVMVAINVSPRGIVLNVRVLDANPRGMFEENVIAAVKDWRYDPIEQATPGNIVLTQKIQLFWKDYPNNNFQLK